MLCDLALHLAVLFVILGRLGSPASFHAAAAGALEWWRLAFLFGVSFLY
jgi:hypothetical protein